GGCCHRPARRTRRADRRTDPGRDERKRLPLRDLSADYRGNPPGFRRVGKERSGTCLAGINPTRIRSFPRCAIACEPLRSTAAIFCDSAAAGCSFASAAPPTARNPGVQDAAEDGPATLCRRRSAPGYTL